jgi:hypothetical protein
MYNNVNNSTFFNERIQEDENSYTSRRRVNNSHYTRIEDYSFSTTIPRKIVPRLAVAKRFATYFLQTHPIGDLP